jgi:hypothetical protein
MAADYYKFATDHGHSEADINYRRCCRLLGRWDPPDRSSDVSSHRLSRDTLAEALIACLQEPAHFDAEFPDLIAAIERLKRSMNSLPILPEPTPIQWSARTIIHRGDSFVVKFTHFSDETIAAVKTPTMPDGTALVMREATLHKRLNHPLVIGFRELRLGTQFQPPSIATEYAGMEHYPAIFR